MSRTTVAIGMFDGVHLGHRFLLDRLRRLAASNGTEPAVVTFDRHPLAVVCPDRTPLMLTDVDHRVDLIRQAGVERVEVLHFDERMRALTAAEFCRDVLEPILHPSALLLGYDHGFGSDRLKGLDAYTRVLAPLGIEVSQCPPYPGRAVSSSLIRASLAAGKVDEAADMLGRRYDITGVVGPGKRLGRTIGFPTANIVVRPDIMVPGDGVYAARVVTGPEAVTGHRAMVNIGTAPTVNGAGSMRRTIEAHILDADTDLYGRTLTLAFDRYLRPERRFDSLDELRDALVADRRAVESIYMGKGS